MARRAATALVLAALTFVLYAKVGGHGYVDLDDPWGIVVNPDLRVEAPLEAIATAFRTTLAGNWVPVTVLSLQIDRALWGGEPTPALLTNAALHALAAGLLFLALARLTGGVGASLFVAGVFAFHPLHVESVAWASMRKDCLLGLFFAATLWSHAAYADRRTPARYALVSLMLLLALLSKPVAVTLPCVLLLLDWWPLGRLRRRPEVRGALLEKLPWLAAAAAVSAVTLSVQQEAGALPGVDRLGLAARVGNALDAWVAYLRQTVWPVDLAVFYPHPRDALPAARIALDALLLSGITGVCVWQARVRGYLLVGWLWFVGMLVPMIGLVQVGMQARADRYTYLPLIGLSLAVAFAAAEQAQRGAAVRRAATALGCALVAACAFASWRQLDTWADAVALHARAVEVAPESAVSRLRLANALRATDRPDEALPHYEKAVELAPRLPDGLLGLADLRARGGDAEAAERLYRRAIAADPENALAHANLGLLLVRGGRDAEARSHLERALAAPPEAVGAHATPPAARAAPHAALARALYRAGDLAGAERHYQRALELDPDLAGAEGNLGFTLVGAGRFREALPFLRRGGAANPYSPELQATLALTYRQLGDTERAIHYYRNALRLRPGWRHAANDLAWLLATTPERELRDPEAAVGILEPVVKRDEPRSEFLDTLAAAYAAAGKFEDAVRTADRALAVAPEGMRTAIRARRDLYARGRAFVDRATVEPRPEEGRPPATRGG